MDFDILSQQCGDRLFSGSPGQDPELAGCVSRAMQLAKAQPLAIAFFETSGEFLTDFEELGRIDFGRAAFPAFNQGRGEPVLLNGSPSIIYPAGLIPDGWQEEFSYENLISQHTSGLGGPTVWPEYGRVLETGSGGQTLTLTYPVQEGRAAEAVGSLRLSLTFDSFGQLESAVLLPAVEE